MNDEFEEIKTGNGKAADLTATTNDRLKKTILELRDLRSSLGLLDDDIKEFSEKSDKWSGKLVRLTQVLVIFTVVLVLLTLFLIGITLFLIRDTRDQARAQSNVTLNGQFFTTENETIIGAIEHGSFVLQPKGKFTTDQLDNYLGEFEVIDTAYKENMLSEGDLCISFSYYTELTEKNSEVQKYIQVNQPFFQGFMDVVNIVKKSRDPNCHQ